MGHSSVVNLIAEIIVREVCDEEASLSVDSKRFFDTSKAPSSYLARELISRTQTLAVIDPITLDNLPNLRGEYLGEIHLCGSLDSNKERLDEVKNELIAARYMKRKGYELIRPLYLELFLAALWSGANYQAGKKGISLSTSYPAVEYLWLMKSKQSISRVIFGFKQVLEIVEQYEYSMIEFDQLMVLTSDYFDFLDSHQIEIKQREIIPLMADRVSKCFFEDYLGLSNWQNQVVVPPPEEHLDEYRKA